MTLSKRLDNQNIITVSPGMRIIEGLSVGNYRLSIQASKNHYCTPREIFSSYDFYESFEMMVLKKDGKSIQFKKSSKFRNFPRYRELLRFYDGNGIFGFVPKDIIEDLITYLK